MHIRTLVFSLVFCLFSTVTAAGEGHSHSHSSEPVSHEQAVAIATNSVDRLASLGKIDKSWAKIKAEKAEQKEFDGAKEWVVIFNNKSVADASRQRIYVFLTLAGEYVAANYTGE